MFRFIALSGALSALVACEEEPLDAAEFDTGAAFFARSAEAVDEAAAGGQAIKVPCSQSRVAYTNGTKESKCINVVLDSRCNDSGRNNVRVGGDMWSVDEVGSSVDVTVPAGGRVELECGGFLNDTGCCTFSYSAGIGACAE